MACPRGDEYKKVGGGSSHEDQKGQSHENQKGQSHEDHKGKNLHQEDKREHEVEHSCGMMIEIKQEKSHVRGYNSGYEKGYEDGFEEGYDSGYDNGYEDGYENTRDTKFGHGGQDGRRMIEYGYTEESHEYVKYHHYSYEPDHCITRDSDYGVSRYKNVVGYDVGDWEDSD